MTDQLELRRLTVRLDRELAARAALRTLLVDADLAVARHRQALRTVTLRVRRESARAGRAAR